MEKPAVSVVVQKFGRDPFLILITCLLSLRSKDSVTIPVSLKLFQIAKTPSQMLQVPISRLEKILYEIGFYRKKAQLLHTVSKDIIERFEGKVPSDKNDLLSIEGVGPKTANLVLGEGFGIPAICVDTHVHRISNRLGLVSTKTPEETEKALEKILPKEYWIEFNYLLVIWGQNICVPISPFCSRCAISDLCPQIGVKKHR